MTAPVSPLPDVLTQDVDMARLVRWTVEFGLVHERGATRPDGSGLSSPHRDAANALERLRLSASARVGFATLPR
jgi:phenylalanine-4-hydroxylase